MEGPTNQEFLKRLSDLRFEPTRVQSLVVDMFERSLENEVSINDPGTPAMKLLEMMVMLSTAAVRNDEVLDRKSYPFMALDESDLFGHMSDKDYLDMFSVPGESTFKLLLSKSEIINRSVPVGGTSIRKLTIPKHTRIVAGGIPFTMQYPIDFLVKRNGAIDIIFDLSKTSPLQSMSTNKVDWEVIQVTGINDVSGIMDILILDIPMKQMLQTSYYTTISTSTVLKKRVKFNNKFHYVRAYIKDSKGQWDEIATTFNEQTFDVAHPTMLLKVVDDELTYELPYIYLMGTLTGKEIRVDVYTTNGKYDANLAELDPKQFSIEFLDLDNDNGNIYTSPVSILDTLDIRNMGYVSGGRDAPNFRKRREMVINNNIGEIKLPITEGQLSTAISRLGFDSALAIDDITRRTYIASRRYPTDREMDYLSIDAGLVTLRSSFEELTDHPSIHDNKERLVLTPDILYTITDDGLKILDPAELQSILSMDKESMVNSFNINQYLWTPFHYVLDITDNKFKSSAYLLTEPKVLHTSYIYSNEETGLIVMTGPNRKVEYRNDRYRITLVSDSSKSFKDIPDDDVAIQIRILDGSVYGYMNGNVIGRNERDHLIVEFDLKTNWNIVGREFDISGFSMKNGSEIPFSIDLKSKFEVLWGARLGATDDVVRGPADNELGHHLLDGEYTLVYHEEMTIEFGHLLEQLWTGARLVAGDRTPKRYHDHVYLTYGPSDISRFLIDESTGLPEFQIVNGRTEMVVLHQVGDPVLDPITGEPIILHHKDSIVLDSDGEIEYESTRYSQWWIDLILFDARFKYSTTDEVRSYIKYISNLTVEWSNRTLEDINRNALERTKVFFAPKSSIGDITVIADDHDEVKISPNQSIVVELFVLKSIYSDYELRESIEATVLEDVMDGISGEVVSVSDIEESIMTSMPNDVLGISISGIGGSRNYRTITILDSRNRMSIDKEMYIDSDYTIGIKNNILVSFKLHGTA